jgi:hypothetical protein
VVPPGEGWTGDPFVPEVRGGLLYGRGAVDMKGAIAAFIAAAADVPEHRGTLSFIITGDEEGPAIHGTQAIMAWMEARGIRPDAILIGEPTSEARLGDVVKIGRRGTVNMWVTVPASRAMSPIRTARTIPCRGSPGFSLRWMRSISTMAPRRSSRRTSNSLPSRHLRQPPTSSPGRRLRSSTSASTTFTTAQNWSNSSAGP